MFPQAPDDSGFLPAGGNYQDLLSYQKSEIIYDFTFRFCERFLKRGDRTIDQMVQAARSGKQNIAICLIHQANYLLDRQIKRLEKGFLEKGGLRENMTKARLEYRKRKKE
ncbi:hypothetical protein HQ447_13370 [bacterium]|nr:hypothetical protein [bacterium]